MGGVFFLDFDFYRTYQDLAKTLSISKAISSGDRTYSSKNSAFGVDSEPNSPREEVMFALAGRFAAFADYGMPILKIHSTVINRRNYDLPYTICEAVLPVSDDPYKPFME